MQCLRDAELQVAVEQQHYSLFHQQTEEVLARDWESNETASLLVAPAQVDD